MRAVLALYPMQLVYICLMKQIQQVQHVLQFFRVLFLLIVTWEMLTWLSALLVMINWDYFLQLMYCQPLPVAPILYIVAMYVPVHLWKRAVYSPASKWLTVYLLIYVMVKLLIRFQHAFHLVLSQQKTHLTSLLPEGQRICQAQHVGNHLMGNKVCLQCKICVIITAIGLWQISMIISALPTW